MKKKIFLLIILTVNLSFNGVFAEDKKDFTFLLPTEKLQNSLYNKMEFLDSRMDTTNLGVVFTGLFNSKTTLFTEESISTRFQHLFQNLIDSTAQDGVTLLQLIHLNFKEMEISSGQVGYCFFSANLYQKDSAQYRKLAEIDTVILVRKRHVTNALLDEGRNIIYDFLKENLVKKSTDSVAYSYNHVQIIDYFDKQKLKLYTTEKYKDGIYYTYQSFRDQTPGDEVIVSLKDDNIASVKIQYEGKMIKINPGDIYALVYNGKPYISTSYDFFPLMKANDDFYFKGIFGRKMKASEEIATAISAFFGVLWISAPIVTYLVKIDYKSGMPIIMKRLNN